MRWSGAMEMIHGNPHLAECMMMLKHCNYTYEHL